MVSALVEVDEKYILVLDQNMILRPLDEPVPDESAASSGLAEPVVPVDIAEAKDNADTEEEMEIEIDFIEEKDRVYLVKRKGKPKTTHSFRKLRGIGNVKMTTDEIMALTRGDK